MSFESHDIVKEKLPAKQILLILGIVVALIIGYMAKVEGEKTVEGKVSIKAGRQDLKPSVFSITIKRRF